MSNIVINIKTEHKTLKFAAEELKKYLNRLDETKRAEIVYGKCISEGYNIGITDN